MWILAYVKAYSGGRWAGDWIEHFERAIFFLKPLPLDYSFLELYGFTARPPMGNALYACFMAMTQPDFTHFQIACTSLNLLVFFPAVLLLKRFHGGRILAGAVAVLVLCLMCNPMFMQNAIYAWTRHLCAFYILLGLHLFLRSREQPESLLLPVLSFASLAAGLLVHYSVGPFILTFLAVYFFDYRDQLLRLHFWRKVFVIGSISAVILLLWFGWAVLTYGVSGTFLSNTAVTDVRQYSTGGNVIKILLNLFNSLVPYPLRGVSLPVEYNASDLLYYIRDYFFSIYQVSLFPMMGMVTVPVLLIHYRKVIWDSLRSGSALRSVWVWWCFASVVLGIAVHGGYDAFGLAHICLQPLALLAVVFLSASYASLTPRLRALLFTGLVVDLLLGVALHYDLMGTGPRELLFLFADSESFEQLRAAVGYATTANFQAQLMKELYLLGEFIQLPQGIFRSGLLGILLIAGWRLRKPD